MCSISKHLKIRHGIQTVTPYRKEHLFARPCKGGQVRVKGPDLSPVIKKLSLLKIIKKLFKDVAQFSDILG